MVEGLYKDLKPDGSAEHEQCRVRVNKKDEGKNIHWTIEVAPKGDWGVAEVQYPLLFLPKLKNDYLVLGKRIGERIPISYVTRKGDVLPEWAFRSEMQAVPDLFNKKCSFWGRYPGGEMILQMMAYENDKEGVMIWTPDSEGWVKDFVIARDDLDETCRGKGYRAYLVHFPENTGQKGTGFKSPYPVVTTPYTGGWYTAALIYKDWARKQWWCAQGKIYDRPNTPPWFKELQAWYGVAGNADYILKGLLPAKQLLGNRVFGAQWMNWSRYYSAGTTAAPDFLPASEEKKFQANINLMKDGIYLAPYLMFSRLVPAHEELYARLKGSALVNADGSIPTMYEPITFKIAHNRQRAPLGAWRLIEKTLQYKTDLMEAWEGPLARELIARMKEFPMPPDLLTSQQKLLAEKWGRDDNVIEKLQFFIPCELTCLGDGNYLEYAAAHADKLIKDYQPPIVYFDTFPHTPLPCYNKAHGHPLGYGRHTSRGNRELCVKVLEKNPSIMLACESGAAEYLLDVMHLTYHKGLTGVEYAIPLFATVYQGFLQYNGWWMWPPYERDEDFTSTLAFSTHLGYMPGSGVGGGPIAHLLKLKAPSDDPKIKFFNATIDMRAKNRDYVASGERLCDPIVAGVSPREVRWSRQNGAKYAAKMQLPPVLASRWGKNGEKEKELLLVSNDSAQKQTATVDGHKVDLEPYSWQGLEVKGGGEHKEPGKAEDSKTEPATETVETKSGAYAFGVVMGIDKAQKLLTVESVDSEGKMAVKKVLKLKVAPESKFENVEGLEKLWIGNVVEVYYQKLGDGNEITGTVEKLIYKPEGRKAEEG